jgi:hypothetical protein
MGSCAPFIALLSRRAGLEVGLWPGAPAPAAGTWETTNAQPLKYSGRLCRELGLFSAYWCGESGIRIKMSCHPEAGGPGPGELSKPR